MIKILHLIDHYKIGGPGKTIINSAKFINKENFEIHVASFCINGEHTEFSKAVVKDEIKYLMLNDKRGINFAAVNDLKDYIEKNKIDILHTHVFKSDFFGILLKFKIPSIKLITTHHGWIRNSLAQKIYMSLDLRLSKFFDGVIIVSHDLYNKTKKSLNKKGFVTVIHNAIVTDDYKKSGNRTFLRKKYNLSEEDIVLGIVSRLSIEKGILDFIECTVNLFKKYKKIKLVIVGDGPMEMALKEKVKKLKLESSILFTGHMTNTQHFYEVFDIFINPSRTEGISNVILEAMANRVPVIATNVGGTKEIIDHPINGTLIDMINYKKFPIIIEEMINKKDQWDTITTEGYKKIKRDFSFMGRMRKIESFYRDVLSRR
jgi:glycosyltransferase involved in cell wall biosynthesis